MSWGWYPRPPKRPPPEHGIRVKATSATWWGQRWVEALERLSREYANRLARGRAYARAGRVHDLEVKGGTVTARVTGSRPAPYRVALRVATLGDRAWERAVGEMAGEAAFAAELLAGQMPREVDRAFRAAGQSLFPVKETDLETSCSCPDWANPCKHVAATHYVLGDAFDKDPFLLFELRGRPRDEVLDALRRRRAAAAGGTAAAPGAAPALEAAPSVPLAGASPDDFERLRGPIDSLRFRIETPALPAALLRHVGEPPAWSLEASAVDVFAPLYQAAGALARELALRPAPSAGHQSGSDSPTSPARARS